MAPTLGTSGTAEQPQRAVDCSNTDRAARRLSRSNSPASVLVCVAAAKTESGHGFARHALPADRPDARRVDPRGRARARRAAAVLARSVGSAWRVAVDGRAGLSRAGGHAPGRDAP